MGTKNLHFPQDTSTIKIQATEQGSELVEIEVPTGLTHYVISPQITAVITYRFHLRHSESQVLITSNVIARGEDHPSLSTEVIHHAPHTLAETHIRTVVFDAAHPAYSGTIHIDKGAHDCESYLNHHALLLGEKAQSRTRPSLEILNDQVKCSHAATIRTITDLDLFYLRSRGISPEEGRDMLIEAFLAPL